MLFAASYLLVWGAVGLLAYGCSGSGASLFGGDLAWEPAVAGWPAECWLSPPSTSSRPLKDVCLAQCRSPLGFLLGHWRDGRRGAVEMGARHAGWCLGCCGGLMVALFALGVMSLTWMALVAALIALEKTVPWRRTVTWGTAALLLALAMAVVAVPHERAGAGRPRRVARRHVAR